MKNQNVFGIIATAIAAIGTFLPFTNISVMGIEQNIDYISGDGKIVLIVCVIALILLFLGKNIGLIICGIVNLAIVIYDGFISWEKYVSAAGMGQFVNRGIGLWLVLIGSILMIVAFFANKEA